MFFRKPSTPKGGSRAPASPPFERQRDGRRCVVEALAEMRVSGWAASANGQPLQIELCCAGQPLAAPLHRVARGDVLAHLGGPADGPALGFALDLPPALWDHASPDGSVNFHLQIEGDDRDMPSMRVSPADLDAWLDRLLTIADSDERHPGWLRAEAHLRRAWPPERWQAAQQRWLQADEAHRARERLPGARLKWAIEQRDGPCLVGWAADPHHGDDEFTLTCNGEPVPAGVIRFERADVHQMLAGVRLDSGFELELPPRLWRAIPAGETGTVQVSLSGWALLEPPLRLSREALRDWIEHAHAEATGPVPTDPAEQHYRCLLLLEHAVAAGVGPLLNPGAASWLATLAERHGVELPWTLAYNPRADASDASQAAVNQAIWRLQRRFNDELATGAASSAELLGALDRCVADAAPGDTAPGTLAPEARRRFLVSMVPFFCAADALPALRPRLDEAELQTLTLAHGRWELSLLLPVTLLDELATGDGRLALSASLMQRLAAATDAGWLNGAGVLDALRRLVGAQRALPLDDLELERFIDAGARLFDGLGDGHDSRLYDEHLVDAACQLLLLAARASQPVLQRTADTVLRHFGLAPAFWQALALAERQAGPDTLPWPAALRLAREQMDRLRILWPRLEAGDASAGPAVGAALRSLRERGCADIDSLQRHALLLGARGLGASGSREAARGLRGLPPQDALRWLGRLPASLPSLAPAHDSDSLLRLAGPVPMVANPALRGAALQSVQALRQALAGGDSSDADRAGEAARHACLAVSGERHGFVGLKWLARCAELMTASGQVTLAASLAQALQGAVDTALSASERGRERHPVPAAALVNALAWLQQRARHTPDDSPLAAFLLACSARLQAQWHADATAAGLPLPTASRLPTGTPGVGALVLVRCSAAAASAHRARIQNGWGARLDQAGVAWAWWHPQPGPAHVEHGGDPQHPARVCASSLPALLTWLVAHSDFGQLLLLDDDAELDVEAWQQHSGAPAHHYHGLARTTAGPAVDGSLDKSLPGTRFATIGNGLGLSRYAVQRAIALRQSARGARLARGTADEEKGLGALMALAGIPLCEEGHAVHQCRPPQPGQVPAAFHNLYLPSDLLPVVLTHAAPLPTDTFERPARPPFSPRRLWPADRAPRLANDGSALQLVELSPPARADALEEASCVVVAVARNERVLLPHFLAHYRQLGARHFVIVDNLSDDGTREYLLAQDDVVVYSADTPYNQSRYGVTWQQAVLAAHATGRWAVLADIDEFLVWPGCETESLSELCARLHRHGAEAARILMIDMYPTGALADADFAQAPPFQAAPCFDAQAVRPWRLGSGSYSNGPSWVSGLRHRLLPGSAPNHYTSQKIALMRHQPWVRCSEGLHYAAGLSVADQPLAFAHFKYHRGFQAKVLAEVARKQHYNGAEEYRQYQALLSEARGGFFDPLHSLRYENSQSFVSLLQ